jgi:hypothetical protein
MAEIPNWTCYGKPKLADFNHNPRRNIELPGLGYAPVGKQNRFDVKKSRETSHMAH